MSITAIIAEYNPFHNGHCYHIRQSKRSLGTTYTIAVLSGSFVQRAEPAVLSKRARTEQALRCGVDAVIELPACYALASAEGFAEGAVRCLRLLGAVDRLSFGSEAGELEPLRAAADALLHPDFGALLREELAGGSPFPSARMRAAMRLAPGLDPAVWQSPNNLLAVEYIKALRVSGAQIEPYTVARRGAGHDAGAAAGDYQSATFCRELIQSGRDCSPYLPAPAAEILRREMDEGRAPVSIGGMERAMLASLRRLPPAAFTMYPDVTEGLENRIADALRRERSMQDVYGAIKSKRYTHARIRRILLRAYLGLHARVDPPEYIRLLGLRKDAGELVRLLRAQCRVPLVVRPARDAAALPDAEREKLRFETLLTDIWNCFTPVVQPAGEDYTKFPVII